MSYAEQYIEVLEKNDLKHSDIVERDDRQLVEFGMHTKDTLVKVLSIFSGDVVSNRVWGLAKVPEDKLAEALFICNEFNQQYKFTKFIIDKDYEIALENDAILDGENAGDESFHLVISMIQIVDETYAKLMKVIWG